MKIAFCEIMEKLELLLLFLRFDFELLFLIFLLLRVKKLSLGMNFELLSENRLCNYLY